MPKYTGINIQYPISRLILSGAKIIETRTYPLPKKLIGVPVLMIETPGKIGSFSSRIVAIIVFGVPFKYASERDFYRDESRHKVTRDSAWAFNPQKGKWGWPIEQLSVLKRPQVMARRPGRIYSNGISLKSN